MSQSPNIDNVATRRKAGRKATVAALVGSGKLTQEQIAQSLGVTRATIARDVAEIAPALLTAKTVLQRMQGEIEKLLPAEQRVQEYVNSLEQAKASNQPSAGLQILARLDAIDGLVTDVERLRTKAVEPQAIVPMFSLPAGASISVTVTSERPAIDVTPSKDVDVLPQPQPVDPSEVV